MNVATNCKFCHKPILVIAGDSQIELEAINKWKPMLCCDRCGNFRVELRKLRERVSRIARGIFTSRPDKRIEVESKSRPELEKATKKIATITCDYYRIQNQWEADFVDNIVENATKSDLVIAAYVSGVSRISKTERAA